MVNQVLLPAWALPQVELRYFLNPHVFIDPVALSYCIDCTPTTMIMKWHDLRNLLILNHKVYMYTDVYKYVYSAHARADGIQCMVVS